MKKIFITLFIFFVLIFLVPHDVFAVVSTQKDTIKILLVPGHDDEIWGSQYGNLKEADMNLVLATKIYNILKKDKRFKVYITRDVLGYTTEFTNYFSFHQPEIISFEENAKKNMQDKINNGSFVKKIEVVHNKATEDVALRLYGINKWADENKIDAVIHIHFNDYPRENTWAKGIYKGFTVYMPEEQMVNSKESTKLAKSIFSQISKKYIPSTYEKELEGLTPDQSLIALGSNGTLLKSVKSVLIEYGYIYRFGNSLARHQMYTNMANLTFSGLKNYFFGK